MFRLSQRTSDTYSLEKEGHVVVYHWLTKDYIVNGEFGAVYH
jgi:hypothetical protein